MLEFLFLDLDDTILDFKKAEHIAVSKAFSQYGLEPTPEVCALYSQCNKLHWEMLERKEISREQVLVGRFQMLFDKLGRTMDARQVARTYEKYLSIGHYFLPGALEAVQKLYGRYRLFLASNGTASVQAGRLDSSGLRPYFEKIFISQELGCNKPDPLYYSACFAQIPDFDIRRALMVGDSLSSDIRGGINAGMKTCWIDGTDRVPEPAPNYRLGSVAELPDLLCKIENDF